MQVSFEAESDNASSPVALASQPDRAAQEGICLQCPENTIHVQLSDS
jgi:hypothetical protein